MKNSVITICLIITVVFLGNCGGEKNLSKSQITKNVMDTLEKSLGGTVTVEGYPSSVGNSKGDYQEIVTFFPTVGAGSPENYKFYVIKEIGELEKPPRKPGEPYQRVGKYRITGTVTKRKLIEIDGLVFEALEESYVIEATSIELLSE